MNKQSLIQAFTQEVELEQELKEEIIQYLNQFPEELSQENLSQIDAYLADVQSDELELAHAYETLLHDSEQYIKEVENNHEEFVTGVAQTMKDELQHLEVVQKDAE